MKRVFISYARRDQSHAERLYEDLKKAGFEPWLDRHDLLPGEKWEEATMNAISHQSSFFIALLSNHSLTHQGFVQKELNAALDRLDYMPHPGVFLIPVRLESCYPNDPRLRKIHWVDLFPHYEDGFGKLAHALTVYHEDEMPANEGFVQGPPHGLLDLLGEGPRPVVVHVEDEKAYERFLRPRLPKEFRYTRVSLLSEAAEYIGLEEVVGFIIDLRLHGGTSTDLINRIRRERPAIPVVVLTNYPDDPDLKALLRAGVLEQVDIFSKADLGSDKVLAYIIDRIYRRWT